MPTAKELLAKARVRLSETETPSLDARLLLQHATGLSHSDLVANPSLVVDAEAISKYDAMVARRVLYEPTSRILGVREFYGRAFRVTPDVLDPRADTESVIETCLRILPGDDAIRILDLGTGSGILALTILAELPNATGVATDVSVDALCVAQSNASALGVAARLTFVESSWFSHVQGAFDLVVSNPPYIPAGDIFGLDQEVQNYDPHLALVGGEDGLECYRMIAAGSKAHLTDGGAVVLEIGAGQAADVAQIFAKEGFNRFDQNMDLGGHLRCLAFRTTTK
jgi:release factor glutamine methyltransferase